ncbi:fimbria/pilus outer membrane usher protein [Citrobacter arsenatis]|uniref:fimbria/pilus outer membrane usher protein n=1 Tax=Citrobacter arsenatis TaxID=2546350 RepID=UPI00300E3C68
MSFIYLNRISRLLCWTSFFYTSVTYAGSYFDPGLLQNPDGAPPIENLQPILAGEMPPGIYHVSLTINGKDIRSITNIRFEKSDAGKLVPCLQQALYQAAQINYDASGVNLSSTDPRECILLSEAVPAASAHFDPTKMILSLSFPQEVQKEIAQDEVPPSVWDDGIPAIIAGYQFSGNKILQNSGSNDNSGVFSSLKYGANISSWRFRQTATLQKSNQEQVQWETQDSYLERAIPALKSEITLGESYTSGDLFDTLRIRGAQLSSDTQMLPSSLNGFSPTIRGVAHSNAVVTVRQNGYILYQTNVGQGPFVINSLAPVSSGGTLDITVHEADGREQHFSQSFSSLTNLEREGGIKYNLALGQYSDAGITRNPPELAQLSAAWGIPHNITLFNGYQLTRGYRALNVGVGSEFGWLGAFTNTLTWEEDSNEGLNDNWHDGYSVKTVWANTIEATDTELNASVTQSHHDYLALADALRQDNTDDIPLQQYSLSLNQFIPGDISAFVSMNGTHYLNDKFSRIYQFGLSKTMWKILSSVTFSMNENTQSDNSHGKHAATDKQLSLNFSLPMSAFTQESTTVLNMSMNSNLQGDNTQSVGASGNIGGDPSLTWLADMGYSTHSRENNSQNGDISLSYKGRFGEFNGGYTQDETQKQFVYGGSGEITIHQHGFTPGQYSDGAMALVSAPGAGATYIDNHTGVATDDRGYTTVPDITPYSYNDLRINKDHLSKNVAFDTLAVTVVPTKDAVVLADFKPTIGRKVLFTLEQQGAAIPFGAKAKLASRDKEYFVGDRGALFIEGVPDKGKITIQYQKRVCQVDYLLPAEGEELVTIYHATCIPKAGKLS